MKQIQGDLLKIGSGLILHQVNFRSVCGGLAGALERKYPGAFAAYHSYCQCYKNVDHRKLAGLSLVSLAAPTLSIAHVFGQLSPGPNTDLKLVDQALEHLVKNYHIGSDVYCPDHMGCGLGGGNWPDYLALLVKYIPDIIIVKKYD